MSFLKIKTRFGELVGNSEWMNTPEEYLGPNYQAVIDWWTFLGHTKEVGPLGPSLANIATAINTGYRAYYCASDVIEFQQFFQSPSWPHDGWNGLMSFRDCYVTLELIAMHSLLDEGYYFPYIKLVEKIQ